MSKKIGLALGSGASRGLAHIGVIRALEENNIPIDCISGTSMGAAIGGMYACGSNIHFLPAFLSEINEKAFFDFRLPKKGMIAGKRFEELLHLFTKDMNFEDLNMPFSCVACDLLKGKGEVFTTGKVYKAIRCSVSIPGAFEPYKYRGGVYVDGAVVDRVPVHSCRDLGADVVIGVDVGYKGTPNSEPKNVIEVMMTAFDIMGWEMTKHKISTADYMIMPDVTHVNPYKIADCDECIQVGYDTAIAELPKIKDVLAFNGIKLKR